MWNRASVVTAVVVLLHIAAPPASAGPSAASVSANVNYYVDAAVAAAGPSEYRLVQSGPPLSVNGCMVSTAVVRACASSTAAMGLLSTQSSLSDTAPASMAGSSESANGYAAFRDVVMVRGLPASGQYRLVPTVTIEGSTSWNGVVQPFTANVGVQLFNADGVSVIDDTTLETAQPSVAITRALAGIPFTAGVPFNVMIGFGHAARLFRHLPGNTSVMASYTLRVSGLTVLDGQGHEVTGFSIGGYSGAAYSANGIAPVDVEGPDFDFTVSGPEQTLIPNGNPWDLKWTPDEGVSYRIFDGEVRMWFVGGVSTYLTRGTTFENLVPWPLKNGKAVPLFGPSGSGFDANYAGASSVVPAANGRDLLMFYHAEIQPCGNYIPFIAGIGLARSTDGGLTWQKRGQVLRGAEAMPTGCDFGVSGVGNPSVFRSRDGRWLYMLFVEWGRTLPGSGPDSVFIARAPIESDGEPGAWKKYAYGTFEEPGLGGSSTPIVVPPSPANETVYAALPSVSWNVALERYLMTFMTFHGVYVTTSPDGIHWDRARRVWSDLPIHVQVPGKGWFAYPSLVSPDQPSQETTGQHGYLYFARGFYGQTPPHVMSRLRFDIGVPSGATTDTDGDGLPDAWERAYGLDALTAADGTLDSDLDGVPDRQEYTAGTHPRGTFTRYLAEGASSAFFETSIALLNTSTAPAHVMLSYLAGDGTVRRESVVVGPESRRTVTPGQLAGMQSVEFATTVESDEPIVVDRTMRWPPRADAYGSHADRAVTSPGTTWYLAEGATHSGFDLFYLIENPGDTVAEVSVEFLRPPPSSPTVATYSVGPRSRFNIWVDTLPGLGDTDVSAVLRSNVPIIVERAMYLTGAGRQFEAGHESAGIAAPEGRWFFAEGATGDYFDMFILIANPEDRPATVSARYLLPDGSSLTKTYVVAARSRFTIWVDQEDPRLRDTAVSTVITSTNDVPIVAERSMWWPGPTSATWGEAHASPGATRTEPGWCLAEGEAGPGVDTYILVANTSDAPRRIRATLFFEDGQRPVSSTFDLSPTSRFNVYPPVAFPGSFDSVTRRRFGARIDALPAAGQAAGDLVVERAVYSGDGVRTWAAGSNALATPCQ